MTVLTSLLTGRFIRCALITLLLGTALFIACNKKSEVEPVLPVPVPPVFICPNAPSYGDSVLIGEYKNKKEFIVDVQNDPGAGIYYSWPLGLSIDKNTGAINVTKSESGIKYNIGFVKDRSKDTCRTNIIISGVNYVDSIYVLSRNDTLALPYFNAQPLLTAPCDASDDNDYPRSGGGRGKGNSKCEFDDDEDRNDLDNDEDENQPPAGQTANEQKVRVRTISGIINLKRTLEEGAFGHNPKNGASTEVTLYYRLNDGSKKSLRKIRIKLMYYQKKTDVPKTMSAEISNKRKEFMQEMPMMAQALPRPPLIIITRDVQ
ncbi:MAG TPA: hypothetical protein VM012_05055 [Flavitalea sp.]|nr:hypothetical protein [Flavitalea sp.]